MDHGQLAVAATSQALGSGSIQGGIRLVAQVSNLLSIYVGATSGVTVNNGYELKAGESMDFSGWMSPPTDLNQIFVICPTLGLVAAPRICWIKQC